MRMLPTLIAVLGLTTTVVYAQERERNTEQDRRTEESRPAPRRQGDLRGLRRRPQAGQGRRGPEEFQNRIRNFLRDNPEFDELRKQFERDNPELRELRRRFLGGQGRGSDRDSDRQAERGERDQRGSRRGAQDRETEQQQRPRRADERERGRREPGPEAQRGRDLGDLLRRFEDRGGRDALLRSLGAIAERLFSEWAERGWDRSRGVRARGWSRGRDSVRRRRGPQMLRRFLDGGRRRVQRMRSSARRSWGGRALRGNRGPRSWGRRSFRAQPRWMFQRRPLWAGPRRWADRGFDPLRRERWRR